MSKEQTDHATETPRQPDATGAADGSGHVESGVATDVWLSLLPHPRTKKQRLCLRVNEEWRHWDYYDPHIWQSVQSVFCNCANTLEVVVWYKREEIVGLVVRSKYSLAECD